MGGAADWASVVIHYADALGREDGNVTVGEEENLPGVLEKGGNVAGDEIFALAQADDGRRAEARSDDFLWFSRREKDQRVDSAELLQRLADGFFQADATLRILLDEVRDDLGVGFGDELMAFALEPLFQLEIILDNAVVDDNNLTGAIAVRVGVFLGGAAVGGPAGVADSIGAFDRRFL